MLSSTHIDPENLLRHAIIHHQAGQLPDAERLYRLVLTHQPEQPDAHHNLGVLAMQSGRVEGGLPHLKKALDIDPANGQYWLSYARGLLCAGQIEAAHATLQTAIGHGLQGESARVLQQQIAVARANASANAPASPPTGGTDPVAPLFALLRAGRHAEMEAAARMLLRQHPNHGKIWRLLGTALSMQGRYLEAAAVLKKASTLCPNDVEIWYDLGALFTQLGQPDKALPCYARGVEIDPMHAEIWIDFAACANALGHFEEGCDHARRALALRPNHAAAYNNLGISLHQLGYWQEAVASYRRALELKPDHALIHANLGNALKDLGQIQDAVASYRRALELKPDHAEIHGNLGNALHDLGQPREAMASYRRALELKPDDAATFSGMLFCLSHMENVDPEVVFAEHLAFGERFETPLRAKWQPHGNDRTLDRTLRLGFVSADLYKHSVAYFIEPMWRALNKTNLELYVYNNNIREDAVTVRLKKLVDHWRQVERLSDQELAERIRDDDIDILFDLSGHTSHHRLLTFARKPAPVQVTWIGYPETTGLRAMDYKLTDQTAPPGTFDHLYTEKFVCLPIATLFEPATDAPEINALPALTQGFITFGSFNRTNKLGHQVIALWSRVLLALPTARMLIGSVTDDGLKASLTAMFAYHGIDPGRLEFHPRVGLRDYLQLHHKVDILLDTFPYTGGTTTNHALWMGVPILTLTGPSRVHCGSARVLWRLGLPEWVTSTEDEFVSRAVHWASHPSELAMLRAGLRERFSSNPLYHPKTVARNFETAMRIMWRRWCAGLPPERFEVIP
ncbi:MAG: tetratricopeptide repeat protein [Candidatus Contendobacter sp.]|nr:tetratricopeptide repeat protein [Candidatus Contendobacter sp.]